MDWCFDREGLAPLFVDAPPRNSVSERPESVVAIEGSRAQRRILARSGLARYTAPSVKERAAFKLQTTWNKIHQQWVVLWVGNWYNRLFATNADKNDKSLNAMLAVLLLRDASRY